MQIFLTLFIIQFCFVYSIHQLKASDFHVILVGDALSKDINQAAKVDLEKIKNEVQIIAKNGNYKLKLNVFFDIKPMANNVLQAIKNLQPKADDLVLFYFSGHGYRTPIDGDDPWPNLDFPHEHKGIGLKRVIEIIQEKKAKLSIILADCCNWKIPQLIAPVIQKSRSSLGTEKQKRQNYRSLFCSTSGVIAIASARAGKPSYCTVQGSFYTRAFLTSLKGVVESNKREVSWAEVFDGAYNEMIQVLKLYNLEQDAVIYTSF